MTPCSSLHIHIEGTGVVSNDSLILLYPLLCPIALPCLSWVQWMRGPAFPYPVYYRTKNETMALLHVATLTVQRELPRLYLASRLPLYQE